MQMSCHEEHVHQSDVQAMVLGRGGQQRLFGVIALKNLTIVAKLRLCLHVWVLH